ncbi:Long-chain-fatty-acid--CoA ligase [hydrothermal vent metagenome]|uniref:Long-chain-fatty-acid--CoA ligase n=1 Tax=hydrothermal vent metagenome TaxID=652676 RepID=A0A3B0UG97_9ZZZZ
MSKASDNQERYRPWIANYPEGIIWDAEIDTTPVHTQILKACDEHPDSDALDFLGKKTSFKELGEQIRAFAGALQKQLGVKKGSRVALLLPNTPFFPIAYYGTLLAGGTVVNCNPLYTVPELTHITADAGADILVTLDLKVIFEKAEALVAAGNVKTLVVCHFPDVLPTVKKILFKVVKSGEMSKTGNSSVADKVVSFSKMLSSGQKSDPVEIDAAKDVAVQQYTGGTTGLPKGAMLSHANIAANVDQIDKWGCGVFEPPASVVAVLPFFHIFAMTVCLNVPLGKGSQVVMMPRFELKALLDLLVRTRPTIMPAVPTLLLAVGSNRKTTADHLSSIQLVISGGAGLPGETRDVFAKKSPAILAEGYGLTECSPVLCCAALRVASKPGSIGMPVPGTDVQFVDLEDPTKFVAPGERGELVATGKQVMLGYYNNEEATKEAFVNGYFRTGDVGYVDEDGYIFLVDRIKDLIICSGFNVYPRTIEEALYRHEDVDECNVIGVKDKYRGEAPIAFIKLKDGKSATAADIKTFLSEHISKVEMPREFIFKDELPKTLVGKLSKKELREEYAEREASKGK